VLAFDGGFFNVVFSFSGVGNVLSEQKYLVPQMSPN